MTNMEKVRVAMTILFFTMMFIDWDIIWLCLFAVTAIDVVDSVDRMDY